jgi:hypothetical protein
LRITPARAREQRDEHAGVARHHRRVLLCAGDDDVNEWLDGDLVSLEQYHQAAVNKIGQTILEIFSDGGVTRSRVSRLIDLRVGSSF